jgi:carbonic anhydrase
MFYNPAVRRKLRRVSMNNLDHLLQRNRELATQQSAAGTLMPSLPRALPKVKAVIIGCADMRVDPVHVLGTKPGDAVVLRNIAITLGKCSIGSAGRALKAFSPAGMTGNLVDLDAHF